MTRILSIYPNAFKCSIILNWIQKRNVKKVKLGTALDIEDFNMSMQETLSSNQSLNKEEIHKFTLIKPIFNLDDKDIPFGLLLLLEEEVGRLYIATGGYDVNKYWKSNIVRFALMPPKTIFHHIESFVSDNVIRFIDDTHAALGWVLMNYKVKELCFTGTSYGGAFLSVMAYIYEHLILNAQDPEALSKDDQIFVRKFYKWFKKNALDETYAQDQDNCYLKEILRLSELELPVFDKELLKDIKISGIYTFGSPSPFIKSQASKYNKMLGNVHYGFRLCNDFITDTLQEGSSFAWMVKPLNKFRRRSPVGKVIIIDEPKYDHGEYFLAMRDPDFSKFMLHESFELKSIRRSVSKVLYAQIYLLIKYKKYSTIPMVILGVVVVFILLPITLGLGLIYGWHLFKVFLTKVYQYLLIQHYLG